MPYFELICTYSGALRTGRPASGIRSPSGTLGKSGTAPRSAQSERKVAKSGDLSDFL